ALVHLPLQNHSDVPEVGRGGVGVTHESSRTHLATDGHIRVELCGLYSNVGGRRGKLPFRLPHVGPTLEQRGPVADRQGTRQSRRSGTGLQLPVKKSGWLPRERGQAEQGVATRRLVGGDETALLIHQLTGPGHIQIDRTTALEEPFRQVETLLLE